MPRRILLILAVAALLTGGYWLLQEVGPPTVRAGTSLGGPLPGLTPFELKLFDKGAATFDHIWTRRQGLGPAYLEPACNICHSTPVSGGNSTIQVTFFGTLNSDGSFNSLLNEGGEVLQQVLQFPPPCNLGGNEVLPPDATIVASHQSPQTFGMGLIDNIPDASILANAIDKGMEVHGVANIVLDENGNQRVGHFGYKAQLADLLQTTAIDLQSFIGITNPISPTEDRPNGKVIPPGCRTVREPNDDGTRMIEDFHFQVYLAPNAPGVGNANGQALFTSIGCALCHLPTYTTASSVIIPVVWQGRSIESKALENQPVNLYSDLLLHDMGGVLADGLVEGLATGSDFRTTPLWGLSTRLASGDGILHDGRAKDVAAAIAAHGGEAATVVGNFNALSPQDQADLIAFVSSL